MKRILVFSMAALGTAAFATDYDFGPGTMPDADVNGVTLSLGIGVGISSVQSVTFFGMAHTWVGDVTLTLISPDNVAHDLVARVGRTGGTGFGDSSNYLGDYVFADGGASIWTEALVGGDTYNLLSGTYATTTVNGAGNTLASIGAQAAGTWKIVGRDEAGGDVGGWQNARLTATPVPEPVSMIALAAGLAAMARRRKK